MDILLFLYVVEVLVLITHMTICCRGCITASTTSLHDDTTEDDASIAAEPSRRFINWRHTVDKLKQQGNYFQRKREIINLDERTRRTQMKHRRHVQLLEQEENPCLTWEPTLNITKIPQMKTLVVSYCLSEMADIPTTEACLINDLHEDYTHCTVIEKPACDYTFENISSGNFIVQIQAQCDKCYKKIVSNRRCPTLVFEKSITIKMELATNELDNATVFANNSADGFIIFVSCGVVFIIGIIAYIIIKCKLEHQISVPRQNRHQIIACHITTDAPQEISNGPQQDAENVSSELNSHREEQVCRQETQLPVAGGRQLHPGRIKSKGCEQTSTISSHGAEYVLIDTNSQTLEQALRQETQLVVFDGRQQAGRVISPIGCRYIRQDYIGGNAERGPLPYPNLPASAIVDIPYDLIFNTNS